MLKSSSNEPNSDHLDLIDNLDHLDHLVSPNHLDHLDRPDHPGNSDYLDYIDNLDHLDQPDQLNHSESLKHSIWRKKQNSHFLLGLVLLRIFFLLLVTLFCYTLNQALLFEKAYVDYSIRIICWITFCFLKPFAAADERNWVHYLRQIRKGEKAVHKVQVLVGANIALG